MTTYKEVSLINDQVAVRFYTKKHQYRVKTANRNGEIHFELPNTNRRKLPEVSIIPDRIPHVSTLPEKYRNRFNLTSSVTSVTKYIGDKSGLINWAAYQTRDYIHDGLAEADFKVSRTRLKEILDKAPQSRFEKMDRGGKRGDTIHKYIDKYIQFQLGRGNEPKLPKDRKIKKAINQFMAIEEEYDFQYIDSERIIFDPLGGIAGTLDIVCESTEGITVIDIKTGGGVYPEFYAQVAGYARGYFYDTGELPDKNLIIYIPRDGGQLEVFDDTEPEADYQAFLHACGSYWWWKKVAAKIKG